jgi:hypothetical protein
MTDPTPQRSSSPPTRHAPARLIAPEERDAAIARLAKAFERDILPVDEFERRTAAVYRATTAARLDELTGDLPDAAGPMGAVASDGPRPHTRMPSRITTILNTFERAVRAVVPSRLSILALLGNVELDLRDAEFGPGVTELSVRAILGNVEIQLPDDVAVEGLGSGILGSFEARPSRPTRHAPARPIGTVRITGEAILGNVEIEGGCELDA